MNSVSKWHKSLLCAAVRRGGEKIDISTSVCTFAAALPAPVQLRGWWSRDGEIPLNPPFRVKKHWSEVKMTVQMGYPCKQYE